jgi:predicted nucleic acid-binding protein
MAALRRCFLDTSVLLAGIVDLGPPSEAPMRVMAAVAAGAMARPMTAWHCCLELYSVVTRLPPEWRVSPAVARKLVQEEILGRFVVEQLPAEARADFFACAERDRAAGGRIYDVHVAQIARRAGARVVVTQNRRHFTSLLDHGVRVLDAAECVEALGER